MSKRGRGEGNLYQRKDGLWVGRVSLGFVGGKRRRKVLYGKTRRDAAERLTAVLRARQQGLPVTTRGVTVGAFLAEWIKGVPSSVRPSTFRRYEQMVRGHLIPQIGRISLARLAPSDLQAMYAEMLEGGLAPRTAGHAHRILGRALREAEIAGLVGRNVCRLVKPPRVPQAEMRSLTAEETRALLHAAEGNRLHALYAVALASGARQGELLALRWSGVDLDTGTIRITRTLERGVRPGRLGPKGVPATEWTFSEPKTASSRRTIPLGRTAVEALRAHRRVQAEERLRVGEAWKDLDLCFPSEVGTPLDGSNLLGRHYSILARAGLPRVRWHDLRHTAATLLLEAGVHPRAVAERLGHATPSLVMNTYGHVTERMQRDATAAIDRVLGA